MTLFGFGASATFATHIPGNVRLRTFARTCAPSPPPTSLPKAKPGRMLMARHSASDHPTDLIAIAAMPVAATRLPLPSTVVVALSQTASCGDRWADE